ncbi:hypothetical protein, partial [Pseudomonas syringae]
ANAGKAVAVNTPASHRFRRFLFLFIIVIIPFDYLSRPVSPLALIPEHGRRNHSKIKCSMTINKNQKYPTDYF